MSELLTLPEVGALLRLTLRQVRRLAHHPDPLPLLYLSRKEPRVDREALAAWVTRRQVAPPPYTMYSPPHDRDGTASPTSAARVDPSAAGRKARRHQQHGRPVGAIGSPHHGAGRPVDSVRRLRRAQHLNPGG